MSRACQLSHKPAVLSPVLTAFELLEPSQIYSYSAGWICTFLVKSPLSYGLSFNTGHHLYEMKYMENLHSLACTANGALLTSAPKKITWDNYSPRS